MSPFWILLKQDNGSGGDNWSYKRCKAPVKLSPPTNQHPVFFTGRMPFLSPNQQCQSKGKTIITSLVAVTLSGIITLSVDRRAEVQLVHASQSGDLPPILLMCSLSSVNSAPSLE